ncbi:MAG: hypothetical protein IPG17_29930 [Sandaracinaceae bacterium]|jgi:hypothetical protein|nr:hypothetical protein [Sandaracinaceae bacterium]MBK7776780.1 hypothetical protein [Sandaracinaceae bacterium]MBK8409971.1 hypothetical protein [Sandaracinaceae bacterium]MBK8590429.1 hypothetical protein [Sandaracinaceae bacterium]
MAAAVSTIALRKMTPPLLPALVGAAVVALVVGSFFGRVSTITCVRAAGTCHVESHGFLYRVQDEQLPIAEMVGVGVETVTSTNRNRGTSVTTTQHDVLLRMGRTASGAVQPDVRVHTYDVLAGPESTGLAASQLLAFLGSPTEPQLTVTFGTHRTGYAASVLVWVLLTLIASYCFLWAARVSVHREDRPEESRSRVRVELEKGPAIMKDVLGLERRAGEDPDRRPWAHQLSVVCPGRPDSSWGSRPPSA